MKRVSIKVVGAQGQGVNSVGEMCAKGLKREGYCVFGYREYMSLIKGGHSSYQLDVSHERIQSTETHVDILVCFNHHGLEQNARDVKDGGVILHVTGDWEFSKDDASWIKKHGVRVIHLPVDALLSTMKAPPILANVILTAFVWTVLGCDSERLRGLVREQFQHKGEKIVALNMAAIEAGVGYHADQASDLLVMLPEPDARWSDHLLLTGSQAMGLGIVHGGCRLYTGYPMTPSSPLLTYVAEIQNATGMIVKQAEDEITAAQMMSGAMFMGTRAVTATSGGGFDLMTETLSLNALIENPAVFVLAMRPGPATGLPTWTAQGDLLLAVGSSHGEFARLVLAVSDSQDCFDLMPEAMNYAEEFQTPVIVLTDKQIAEAIYTQKPYDQKKAALRRGNLVTDAQERRELRSQDRYDPLASDGISKRWLPGSEAATFCAQGDEHDACGTVDETATNAKAQMEKRMKKMEALRRAIPEPELFGSDDPDLLIVSWGSNKGVIVDALQALDRRGVSYLHYTYLWPLKTEKFERLASRTKKVILVECNHQGQLGMLLKAVCGRDVDVKILQYDGRPFFLDELLPSLSAS